MYLPLHMQSRQKPVMSDMEIKRLTLYAKSFFVGYLSPRLLFLLLWKTLYEATSLPIILWDFARRDNLEYLNATDSKRRWIKDFSGDFQ
jgi:hypothetical protein